MSTELQVFHKKTNKRLYISRNRGSDTTRFHKKIFSIADPSRIVDDDQNDEMTEPT